MQLTSASAAATNPPPRDVLAGETGSAMPSADPRFAQYKVIRRNGAVVGFEPAKITIAMTKAFLAVNGGQGAASARVRDEVVKLTDAVVSALMKRKPEGGAITSRRSGPGRALLDARGEHEVARAYVLYRERRSQARAGRNPRSAASPKRSRSSSSTTACRSRDLERLTAPRQGVVRGPGEREPRADPQGDAQGPYNGVPMDEVRSASCWPRAR
jgi:ribonucleoside-diphosphate reductase alpha chain